MTQGPVTNEGAGGALKPHRGAVILVLGILGLLLCFIFGIAAWVMANNDLREIDAGQMDPKGRDLTQAGKICGIVGIVLQGLGILAQLLIIIVGLGGAAMSAGAIFGAG